MEKTVIMARCLLEYQKLLKEIGLLHILYSLFEIVVAITIISQVRRGELILTIPLLAIYLYTSILVVQQFVLGILAYRFAKSEKVKYCMYAGMVYIVFLVPPTLFSLIFTKIDLAILSRITFGVLYTALARIVIIFDKNQ